MITKNLLYKFGFAIGAAWLLVTMYLLFPDLFHRKSSFTDKDKRSKNVRDVDQDKGTLRFQPASNSSLSPSSLPVIHVCLSADQHTLLGAITAIHSVQKNTKHPLVFHIVVPYEINEDLSNWLSDPHFKGSQFEIRTFDFDLLEGTIDLKTQDKTEKHQPMSFARYFYPDLFPSIQGKFVHLDEDVVVQGDISLLQKTDLHSQMAAFAYDCDSVSKRFSSHSHHYAAYLNFNVELIKALKLSPTMCTFNAGVFVADATRWRQENITGRLMHWMHANKEHEYFGHERGGGGSLPPMLIVFYKNYTHLDPLWHVGHLGWRSSKIFSAEFIRSAKLLHWNGHFKPWQGHAQFSQLWDKYHVPDPRDKYKPTRKAMKTHAKAKNR